MAEFYCEGTKRAGARRPRKGKMDSHSSFNEQEMETLCKRYRRCYAGLVYDVLENLGYANQALSPELAPLTPEMKLAGPAFTVRGMTTTGKNEALRYRRLEMLKHMRRPCVEVRDRGTPYPVAIYGELTATGAAAHGAVGALVDGGTRDSGKVIEAGFPLFARYRCPIEAFGRWAIMEYQVPILMSGALSQTVTVCPGDFIFGDYDGVLVIPKDLTLAVLVECERLIKIEDSARAAFARGDDPVEVYARHKVL